MYPMPENAAGNGFNRKAYKVWINKKEALLLYAKSPSYRDFVKKIRQGGVIPDHLNEYFGYGLFIGWKE